MELTRVSAYMNMTICIALLLSLSIFIQSEARVLSEQQQKQQLIKGRATGDDSIMKTRKKLLMEHFKHLDMMEPIASLDLPNPQSYGIGSPFTMPPYDSLAPTPLPQTTSPFCEYPPLAPLPPSITIPTPNTNVYTPPSPNTNVYTPPSPSSSSSSPLPSLSPPIYLSPLLPYQSPPQIPPEGSQSPPFNAPSPPNNSPVPFPPEYSSPYPPDISPPMLTPPESSIPNPPSTYVPSPPYVPSPFIYVPSPGNVPSPPDYEPSPPGSGYEPSPPTYVPVTPPGFLPSPPVFQPPDVFPPPSVPPSPYKGPGRALWCVAKPSVPDPIIQEAMNYACGSGADCGSIQPQGACYRPETLFAHASFAFNSYWQRTKAAGGTCDFGGTAILVTIDPSFNQCHFIAT